MKEKHYRADGKKSHKGHYKAPGALDVQFGTTWRKEPGMPGHPHERKKRKGKRS